MRNLPVLKLQTTIYPSELAAVVGLEKKVRKKRDKRDKLLRRMVCLPLGNEIPSHRLPVNVRMQGCLRVPGEWPVGNYVRGKRGMRGKSPLCKTVTVAAMPLRELLARCLEGPVPNLSRDRFWDREAACVSARAG
jgi:hypothetical protein